MLATDESWEILISADLKPSMTSLVPFLAGEGQQKWPKAFTILHAYSVLYHPVLRGLCVNVVF